MAIIVDGSAIRWSLTADEYGVEAVVVLKKNDGSDEITRRASNECGPYNGLITNLPGGYSIERQNEIKVSKTDIPIKISSVGDANENPPINVDVTARAAVYSGICYCSETVRVPFSYDSTKWDWIEFSPWHNGVYPDNHHCGSGQFVISLNGHTASQPEYVVRFHQTTEKVSVEAAGPINGGTVSISGGGAANEGRYARLELPWGEGIVIGATANRHYRFVKWVVKSGLHVGEDDPHGIDGSTSPTQSLVTLPYWGGPCAVDQRDITYSAVFECIMHTVTVSSDPPEIGMHGSVTFCEDDDDDICYTAYDDSCEYEFYQWSDGTTDREWCRQRSSISEDIDLVARYRKRKYNIDIKTSPEDAGSYTVSHDGPYEYGDTVRIYPHAEDCYEVDSWGMSGGTRQDVEQDGSITVTVEFCRDRTLYIYFRRKTFKVCGHITGGRGEGVVLLDNNGSTYDITNECADVSCGREVDIRIIDISPCDAFERWSSNPDADITDKTEESATIESVENNLEIYAHLRKRRTVGHQLSTTEEGMLMYSPCTHQLVYGEWI